MRTDRKDMTKLTVAFLTFVNALKRMKTEFAQKPYNFTKKLASYKCVTFEDALPFYVGHFKSSAHCTFSL
jgi:hypothetical protein